MPTFYFDTSGLLKRYVEEKGTTWVRSIVNPSQDNTINSLQLTKVEVASGLARRCREGTLTTNERDELPRHFFSTVLINIKCSG